MAATLRGGVNRGVGVIGRGQDVLAGSSRGWQDSEGFSRGPQVSVGVVCHWLAVASVV